MSAPRDFSEEELAQLEAEMDKLSPDDILIQALVTLINLGARKAGLATPPGEAGPQRDLEQTRQAIDGARAILPLLEERHAEELAGVRDALSRLQMAFVRLSSEQPPAVEEPAEPAAPKPGEAGPAQKSGRLWVPGQ
jgi:hypothetical protein